jgi:hypothetical protein
MATLRQAETQLFPLPDSTTNLISRDVIGNKTDAAVTTVGVIASIIAYLKGLLSLITLHKVPTANSVTNIDMREIRLISQ